MKKNIENSDMPISSPTMLAPRRVRFRKIENGISGSRWRRSIATNAISSTTAAARQTIVRVAPQPTLTASTTAYTSSASPPVTATAPGMSKELPASSRRLSRRIRGANAAAAIPIGTLTNSTQRQFSPLVRIPPSSTPAAPPAPATAPQMPERAVALGPVGERGGDDRQRGGGDDRGAQALDRAGGDQPRLGLRQAAGQRGE